MIKFVRNCSITEILKFNLKSQNSMLDHLRWYVYLGLFICKKVKTDSFQRLPQSRHRQNNLISACVFVPPNFLVFVNIYEKFETNYLFYVGRFTDLCISMPNRSPTHSLYFLSHVVILSFGGSNLHQT